MGTMSAAACRKRASFFEELPHTAAFPPPSKRARFRGGGGSPPTPMTRGAADPGLVALICARFPSVSVEFIEKALEECENDLDSAIKCLLNLHLEPTEYTVDLVYQSPDGMSTDVQVPDEGPLEVIYFTGFWLFYYYDFGANFLDSKMMLIGRVSHDGRVNARVKCDLTDNICLKINAQLTSEPHYSQGMFSFDYKGTRMDFSCHILPLIKSFSI